MLICQNCGALNDEKRIYCQQCDYALNRQSQTRPRQKPIITGDIHQTPPVESAREPTIPPVSSRANVNQEKNQQTDREFMQRSGINPQSQPNNFNPPPQRRTGLLITLVLLTGILLAGGFFIYQTVMKKPAKSNTSMFALGEQYFKTGDYPAAKNIFEQFLIQYPNDPLVSVANNRLTAIQASLAKKAEIDTKTDDQVQTLLQKAENAYNRERMLAPEDDNAYAYIRTILSLDPFNPKAVTMRENIIDYYKKKAREAYKRKRYQRAINLYEKVLSIAPGDVVATLQIEQINRRIDALRVANTSTIIPETAPSNRVNPPSDATGDSNTGPSINNAETNLANLAQPNKIENSATSSNTIPVAINPANSDVPINTPDENALPNEPEIKDEPPLLKDPRGKGIRIVYLRKETPVVPRNWNYGGFSRVKILCTVGTDGRVEKAVVTHRAKYRRLNQLSLDAVKKYRYRPVIYNGKPARFEITEEFIYD